MTTPSERPSDGHDAYRTARRAAVKQHHPDRGGSSDELRSALDRVEQTLGRMSQITPIQRSTRTEAPANRLMRTAIHRLRRLLPRRVPGSRRYIDL